MDVQDYRVSQGRRVREIISHFAREHGCLRDDGTMKVREFARWSGINRMNVSNWASGRKVPNIETIRRYRSAAEIGSEQAKLFDALRWALIVD